MGTAVSPGGPVAAEQSDRQALATLERLVRDDSSADLCLVGASGERAPIPISLRRVLAQALPILARGHAVTIVSRPDELTTQQAADILHVSRPYLVRLLDEGVIPSTRTGTHRRVRCDDLMRYKVQRDAERRAALDLLAEQGQEIERLLG